MSHHFYTTDATGEQAPDLGYQYDGRFVDGARLDGTSGYYVFTQAQKDTVPVYRFYNPSINYHFYTTERNGIAEKIGYDFEKIAWHMPSEEGPDTTAYFRFYSPDTKDHLLSTYYLGEPGYNNDGVLGYIYNYAKPGATELQGFVHTGYTLVGTPASQGTTYTLTTTMCDMASRTNKTSQLPLKYVVGRTGAGIRIYVQTAPSDEDLKKGSVSLAEVDGDGRGYLLLHKPSTLHLRYIGIDFLDMDDPTDSECDVGPYIRRGINGLIEFVHP